RRVPRSATSRASSPTRCFWRISTTSDAEHVAAATNSISTGVWASVPSPSTSTEGRPAAPASNSSPPPARAPASARHRMVISRMSPATSVASPRRQSRVQPVVAEAAHAVVFEQPVERGPVMELESDHEVGPHIGTVGVGTAGVVSHEAEPRTHVRRRHLLITGEAIQRLEAAHVTVATVEEADLAGGTDPEAGRDQIPCVEPPAEHQLRTPATLPRTPALPRCPGPRRR